MSKVYTDSELLEKLGDFCDRLGRAPTNREINKTNLMPSEKPYFNRFGSVRKAVKLVRPNLVGQKRYKYNFDVIKDEFTRVVKLIGHIPKAKEFDKYGIFRSEMIVKRYGWNKFIKMAGFETNDYTDFEVLSKLQIFCNELGRKPTFREVKNNKDLPSIGVYNRRFGSLPIALEKVAENLPNKPPRCDVSKECVIEDIKRVKNKLNKIPTRIEFDKHTKTIGSHLISNRYGWEKLLTEIGFIRDAPVKYTKEELINLMKEKYVELGRIPIRSDFAGSPNASTFFSRFGNWENALEKAGFDFKRKMYLSKDGHKCFSTYEYYIDNWLFEHNIAHEKEKKYPFHEEFNKHTLKTADWYINGVYIEFCGMHGRKSYDKKMKIKKKLIEELGLKFIFIYPTDLDKLDKVMGTPISLGG